MKVTAEKIEASGESVDDYRWRMTILLKGCSFDSLIVDSAWKKYDDLSAAWERVNRRSETLFGLSLAAVGWTLVNGSRFSMPLREAGGCTIPFLLSMVLCVAAWWNSGKPTLDLKQMAISSLEGHPSSAIIVTNITNTSIRMAKVLDCKQCLNKLAAISLAIGLILLFWTGAVHLPR